MATEADSIAERTIVLPEQFEYATDAEHVRDTLVPVVEALREQGISGLAIRRGFELMDEQRLI